MLLLDSEALSALAHGPPGRREAVRALITNARRQEVPVGTVAAVLAEVVRGRAADAAVFATIRRERLQIDPVDERVGIRAGGLLGAAGADSRLAVDAFLVAGAERRGRAVVATTDVDDIGRLAAPCPTVKVVSVNAA